MRSQFPSCLSPARAGPEARAQAAGCHGDGWKPATVTLAAVASAMTTATVTVTVTAAFSETGVTRNAVAAGPRSWSPDIVEPAGRRRRRCWHGERPAQRVRQRCRFVHD